MSTCEGKFKPVFDKARNEAVPVPTGERCYEEVEWRVTYLKDHGIAPINCCALCIMDVSLLGVMYSAVRVGVGK